MDEPVVLIWLDAPMQSWGIRSRWDARDTALDPTKSGVIGLLGGALGLERGHPELEQLHTELRFGVRVDSPGEVVSDYQTVRGYHLTAKGEYKHQNGTSKTLARAREHEPSTIVSVRDYLHDAIFLVGLQLPALTEEIIRNALQSPRWPLYLGRKCCPPARPFLDPARNIYPDLTTAFAMHPRHPRALRRGKLTLYLEDQTGDLERQDALQINPLRMYGFCHYRFLEVDPPCISPN